MTLHFLCPRYTIVLVKIDNKKEGVLPSSSFVDFIETLRYIFHSKDTAVHMHKVEPNGSGS